MSSYQPVYGEDQMMNVVGTIGPITIAIHASDNFQNYASGILNDPLCHAGISPNHAVTIVGYGTDNGTPYWLIKVNMSIIYEYKYIN